MWTNVTRLKKKTFLQGKSSVYGLTWTDGKAAVEQCLQCAIIRIEAWCCLGTRYVQYWRTLHWKVNWKTSFWSQLFTWNETPLLLQLTWDKLFSNWQNMKTIYLRLKTTLPCFRVRDDSNSRMAINASSSRTFFLKLSLVWALDSEILRDECKHLRNSWKNCRNEDIAYFSVASTSVNQEVTLHFLLKKKNKT